MTMIDLFTGEARNPNASLDMEPDIEELADLIAGGHMSAAYALLRDMHPGLDTLDARRARAMRYGTPSQEL